MKLQEKNNINLIYRMELKEKIGVLATVQKILFDVLSTITKKENDDKPWKIGCKCKSDEIQEQLFESLCILFKNFHYNVVKEKNDDKLVYIEKIVKQRSESFSDEIN
jgi:hypothetical protein